MATGLATGLAFDAMGLAFDAVGLVFDAVGLAFDTAGLAFDTFHPFFRMGLQHQCQPNVVVRPKKVCITHTFNFDVPARLLISHALGTG